jgi:hypothetical protein
MLPSFKISAFAGKEILLVLSLIHASVQLVSTKAKFIWGCSSGGMGLSFLQEGNNKVMQSARVSIKVVMLLFISFFI